MTSDDSNLPRYDRSQNYRWNYDHAPAPAPQPVGPDIPSVPGEWSFLGLPVDAPLGIPAGPLLNGRWVLYYVSLGFDVLTYKTVRSTKRACYDLPNLQPVRTGDMSGAESQVLASTTMDGSWAVSFGMPSMEPDIWRADVEWTRSCLAREKVLCVSVVGTVQPGWGLEELAQDYALCARWAVESGADVIETNFSCPNVSTQDGQLFQQPEASKIVAAHVRDAIGTVPYLIKIGHLTNETSAVALLEAVSPYADGLAMTNSLATTICDESGELMFDAQPRGICGKAIRKASVAQVTMFSRLISERNLVTSLIGVGGVSTTNDVREYLQAGAESVQIATAAMVDPNIGCQIREELSKVGSQ